MRLIDADRLLSERMKKMYYHLPNGDTAIPIIDIEHAPTVDADQVKHGEWIGIPFSIVSKCSLCGFDTVAFSFRYCPHCGARMKGEDNE